MALKFDILVLLKFSPLEFKTELDQSEQELYIALKFIPLEFKTPSHQKTQPYLSVKIYSVGI